jgi:hypothetical protein
MCNKPTLFACVSLVLSTLEPLNAAPAMAHASLPEHSGGHGPRLVPYHAPKGSGSWQRLAEGFPGSSHPDTALLLTDGTVLMHDACNSDWYRLTPASDGSYVAGTWKKAASMATSYAPRGFASQVLADGRLIVNGGEYNACVNIFQKGGALYDPVKNKWTNVDPPKNWKYVGDAQSVVLADGTYMLADCCDGYMNSGPPLAALATIKGTKVTWTPTGTGKADIYDEEGWSILPGGKVLTVDAWLDENKNFSDTELYDPATGRWTSEKPTTAIIQDPFTLEVGPAILTNTGKVLQIGANPCSSNCPSHSSIYDSVTGRWSRGPDLPKVDGVFLSSEDGPAAELPGGNAVVQLSPAYTCGGNNYACAPSHFFEFDGKRFRQVDEPDDAPVSASYEGRMLMLPTGQVFWSSDTGDIEVYTPVGEPADSWRPTITVVPRSIKRGATNLLIQGTLFNGLSTGSAFGDDAQQSTNYPIVRIIAGTTRHVCYARTHDHSAMGISDGGPTSTHFDVPMNCDAGPSTVEVVANGIPSAPVSVKIK